MRNQSRVNCYLQTCLKVFIIITHVKFTSAGEWCINKRAFLNNKSTWFVLLTGCYCLNHLIVNIPTAFWGMTVTSCRRWWRSCERPSSSCERCPCHRCAPAPGEVWVFLGSFWPEMKIQMQLSLEVKTWAWNRSQLSHELHDHMQR